MTAQRFTLPVGVFMILIQNHKVLLLRRQNTGWHDGDYDLVTGHIDGNESLTMALRREVNEEVGITIDPADATFTHLIHYVGDKEYLYVFFKVSKWRGELVNKEPDKCDDLQWFRLNALPKNITPNSKTALESYTTGKFYSEINESLEH